MSEAKTTRVIDQVIYGYAIPMDELVTLGPESNALSFRETLMKQEECIREVIEKGKEDDYWEFTFYRYWFRNGMLYIGRDITEALENGIDCEHIYEHHFHELHTSDLFQNIVNEHLSPKIYGKVSFILK